jgi:hypothetical protein
MCQTPSPSKFKDGLLPEKDKESSIVMATDATASSSEHKALAETKLIKATAS